MPSSFPLQSFCIKKLFGKYDMDIVFDDVNIFVGNNGIGKTTFLNCVYYVLSRKFEKLIDIQFETIELVYEGKGYKIDRESILKKNYKLYAQHRYPYSFRREIERLKELYSLQYEKWDSVESFIDALEGDRPFYIERLLNMMPKKELHNLLRSELKTFKELPPNLPQYDILYFPTYRRIEEDFSNIFGQGCSRNMREESYRSVSIERELARFIGEDSLIQFGMNDVDRAIKKIIDELKKIAVVGFQNFSETLFTRLFENNQKEPLKQYTDEDIHNLSIIIKRLNLSISEEQKLNMIEKIKNAVSLDYYSNLFVRYLLDIYNSQKEYDTAMRAFVDICSSYFKDKKYIYNENNMELEIRNDEDEIISLSQLSSGEKQIVSLFSKIFLSSPDKNKIVLFDEPELSLSVFWQKKLLPDIMKSGKCAFMVAVTHSPFIFENNLRNYASSLNRLTCK